MTASHWIQIAALTSALGLTGAAIAQNTEGTTSTEDRASVLSPRETPSAGAIVTPEDKALGMGQDKTLSVDPGPSSDDDSSVNPGKSNDEALSVVPDSSNNDESRMKPRPSGTTSVRGE